MKVIARLTVLLLLICCLCGCTNGADVSEPTAEPTEQSAMATDIPAHTADPTDYVDPTEGPILTYITQAPVPFTDYEVMSSVPLYQIDDYRDIYIIPEELADAFEDEEGFEQWDLIGINEEYSDGFTYVSDVEQQGENAPKLEKLPRGYGMWHWGVFGESGVYMLDKRNRLLHVFENGVKAYTIELGASPVTGIPYGGVVEYAEGLWYLLYRTDEIHVYNEDSELVHTIAPSLEGFPEPENVYFTIAGKLPDGTIVMHASLIGYADNSYFEQYYRLDTENNELVPIDKPDLIIDVPETTEDAIEYDVLYSGEDGTVRLYMELFHCYTSDGEYVSFYYPYVRSYDAEGNPIGGFDGFDYINMRTRSRHLCDSAYYWRATSLNDVYLLMTLESTVEVVKVPMNPDFEPIEIEVEPKAISYTYREMLEMGIVEEYWASLGLV